jgi:hypothetical protein
MPTLLADSEVDHDAETLDATLSVAEEQEARDALRSPPRPVDDIRQGKGNRVSKGRAVARRAWMWDGTETVLPIAWNPEGTRHDGGKSYINKKHCLCCNAGGFRGVCLRCVRSNCVGCNAGTDKTKIIPNFYLSKAQVPFPQKFYGPVDCFLAACYRKNGMGFQTEPDMRMHARLKHRMEYASHQESLASQKADQTDALTRRVDELTSMLLNKAGPPAPVTVGAAGAPLYVSDKPPRPRKK